MRPDAFHDIDSQYRSDLEKSPWIDRGLFQNRAERSFRHVARMVRTVVYRFVPGLYQIS